MNEQSHSEIAAWLTQAGLAGETENAIVDGFCERCVKVGLPVARAHVFIDTLDPVHEGRLFRWGHAETEKALQEYGRTARWRARPAPRMCSPPTGGATSPFYRMLQTGDFDAAPQGGRETTKRNSRRSRNSAAAA